MDARSSRIIIHSRDFPPSQRLGETAESYWKRLLKLVKGTGIPRSPLRRCVQHGKYVKSRYVAQTSHVVKSIKR